MYLFIRLLPFILVCFFSISSIFSNDVKGIVYLCGLLLTVGIGFGVSALIGMFTQKSKETNESTNDITSDEESNNKKELICKILSLGFSSLTIPIGELITSFTFIYLLATMILTSTDDSNVVSNNIPTIVFFSILMIIQLVFSNKFLSNYFNLGNIICHPTEYSALSLTIGGLIGWLWAFTIISTETEELHYYNTYDNNEKCKATTSGNYKCKVYKDGQPITDIG
tara:strand:+ start:5744 stop:6418 length:675 start_codon:yes stop_codon:yes gene_type:complete